MSSVDRFRLSVVKHIGEVLTPELAAAIEVACFYRPDESIDPGRFASHEYRGYLFAMESLRLILDELHPLHEAHWATTEKARAGVALNPNYEYMMASERAGKLIQFTARKDGALVGNARFYLFKDLHSQTPGVQEDTIFVIPEHRIGWMPIRFWQYAERCMQQLLGEFEIWTDSKITRDADGNVINDVGRFNKYLGYEHVADRWHKRISKENDYVL